MAYILILISGLLLGYGISLLKNPTVKRIINKPWKFVGVGMVLAGISAVIVLFLRNFSQKNFK